MGLPFIGESFAGGEPNVFRHLVSYPDIASYTEGLVRRAKQEAMTATRKYRRVVMLNAMNRRFGWAVCNIDGKAIHNAIFL